MTLPKPITGTAKLKSHLSGSHGNGKGGAVSNSGKGSNSAEGRDGGSNGSNGGDSGNGGDSRQ